MLLVDDDALVRAGLRMILSAAEDLEVVGEVDDGVRAVTAVREHRPDVVLMDVRMAEMDGITATAALRRLPAPPHIIVLTTFQADEQVVSALRPGASRTPGSWSRTHHPPRSSTLSGRRHRRSRDHFAVRHPYAAPTSATPKRLSDVAPRRSDSLPSPTANGGGRRHRVTGASNAEGAASLFMSEATVKAHVSRLFIKLGVANRVQIAILVHDAEQS